MLQENYLSLKQLLKLTLIIFSKNFKLRKKLKLYYTQLTKALNQKLRKLQFRWRELV